MPNSAIFVVAILSMVSLETESQDRLTAPPGVCANSQRMHSILFFISLLSSLPLSRSFPSTIFLIFLLSLFPEIAQLP